MPETPGRRGRSSCQKCRTLDWCGDHGSLGVIDHLRGENERLRAALHYVLAPSEGGSQSPIENQLANAQYVARMAIDPPHNAPSETQP